MIFNHIPAVTVQDDAELRLLRARWSGGRSPQPYREALAGIVELARRRGTIALLLELEEFPDMPVFDQLWLSTTLWHQVARLQVQRVVIILSGRRVYNRHVVESLLAQFQAQIRTDVQFFTQPEPALDWLTDNSPRVPALLDEWARTFPRGSSTTALAG